METLTIGHSRQQLVHEGGRIKRGALRMPDGSIGMSLVSVPAGARGLTLASVQLLPLVVLGPQHLEALCPSLYVSGGAITDAHGVTVWSASRG